MNEIIKLMKNRIDRLERALAIADLPYHDQTCECCGEIYIPNNYDSIRCNQCYHSCYKPKGSKEWIKGKNCPAVKQNNKT